MIEINELSETQKLSMAYSTDRINIWEGAVRSGKTIASILRWLEYIEYGPKGELLMIGKTHRTLKRNILDVVLDLVGEENYNYNRGLGEVEILGRKVYIAGANDARAADKIRGMTLAGAYGDEVSIWPEDFFKMLLSRLSIKGSKLFVTTNPEGPYHWLKQDYLDKDNLSLARFKFLLEDNPALDKEYIKQLKREYTGVWYQRYIKGLWVKAEGIVYDMFSDRHLMSYGDIPRHSREWIGVDYGTTNDTVFVLVRYANGKLYVVDEYRWGEKKKGTAKTDVQLADKLEEFIDKHKAKPEWIFIDPSAKSFITELARRRDKFPAFNNISRANNEVVPGIQRVSSLLGTYNLLVAEHLEDLKQEFHSYAWDEKAQERGEDKPIKEHDHGLDAIRYVCSGIINLIDYILNQAA